MKNKSVKIEIIDFKPTHVEVRFLSNDHKVKLGKLFFKKRFKAGFYEVVNHPKMLSVI